MLILNIQNRSIPLGPAVAPARELVPFTDTPVPVPLTAPPVTTPVPAPAGTTPAPTPGTTPPGCSAVNKGMICAHKQLCLSLQTSV